jgi:hypothetical protein
MQQHHTTAATQEHGPIGDNPTSSGGSVEGGSIGGRLCPLKPAWHELDHSEWSINFIRKGWQMRGANKAQLDALRVSQVGIPPEHHFTEFERQVRRDTVAKYFGLGIIEMVESPLSEDTGIYHPFICVLNKAEARGCLSATRLNEYIPYNHFKLEGLHTVRDLVQVGDFMGSLDISKYYPHYKVNESHRELLRFQVDGVRWQYIGCPFGLSNLPYLVTKALKPALRLWRSKGIRCVNLLDDIKVFNSDKEECARQMEFIKKHLESLGFVMNSSKEVAPTQQGDCFGLDLDTTTLSLHVPAKKRKDIAQTTKRAIGASKQGTLTVRKLAGLIGKVNFITPAWTAARTYISALQAAKTRALRESRRRWDKMVQLDAEEIRQAEQLLECIRTAPGRCILTRDEPAMVLIGDASKQGWGAYREDNGDSAEGFWTAAEAAQSSNGRELDTPLLALKAWKLEIRKLPRNPAGKIWVKYKSDNQVTVAYLNKKGGPSQRLTDKLRPTLKWTEAENIELTSEYLPGKANSTADLYSRRGLDRHDWRVKQRYVDRLQQRWGAFAVDAFASRLSARVQRFWSLRREPGSAAVDAFAQDWSEAGHMWVCPPPNQIARVIRKARDTPGCQIALCTPDWPTAPWWPLVTAQYSGRPVRLPVGALEASSTQGILPQCNMIAWKLCSGRPRRRATVGRQLRCCNLRW